MKNTITALPVESAKAKLSAVVTVLNEYFNNKDVTVKQFASIAESREEAQKIMDVSAVTAYLDELTELSHVERWEKWLADGMEIQSYRIANPDDNNPIYRLEPYAYGVQYKHIEKLVEHSKSETVLNSYFKSFLANIAKRTCKELESKQLEINSKQTSMIVKAPLFDGTSNTKMLDQLQAIVDGIMPEGAEPVKMFAKDYKIVEMFAHNLKMTNNSFSVDIKNVSKLKQVIAIALYTRKFNGDYAVTCKDKLFIQK